VDVGKLAAILSVVLLTACAAKASVVSRRAASEHTVTAHSSDVQFVDANHGWLLQPGTDTILATTNGGSTWSLSYSGQAPVSALAFVDVDHGWGLTDGDTLLRTTDGGRQWHALPIGAVPFEAITFTNSVDGWALSQDYRLLKTTSGGAHWHAVPTPTSTTAVCANTSGILWTAQSDGTVEKSNDGGRRWTISLSSTEVPEPVAHPVGPGVVPPRLSCSGNSVWLLEVPLCGAGSCAYVVMHTADAGAHWKAALGAGPNLASSLPVIDSSLSDFGTDRPAHAWFFGSSDVMGTSELVTTSDSGATYLHESLYPKPRSTAVFESAGTFLNATQGWAIVALVTQRGPSYALVATTNGGATWQLRSALNRTF
jgi:photosystem II stability/assembly factor-like uncharacterized protein